MSNALALTDAERKLAERMDPESTGRIAVSDAAGGLMFASMSEVMTFSKMMALSGVAVPKHLRANPGACVAVCIQAVEWRMSPYAVANKSYSVNDRLAYESQLVQAVILQRAPIKGRFRVEYLGEGQRRRCRVTAMLSDGSGQEVEYTSPEFGAIQPKNSPLWKTDPDQQQFYYSGRGLCRRHFPDVLLGVYARDEIEEAPRVAETARDVTPPRTLGARLDALAGRPVQPEVQDFEDVAQSSADDLAAQDVAGEGSLDGGETDPSEDVEQPVDPNDADFKRGAEAKREGHSKCLVTAVRENPERFRRWKAGYDSVEAEG